MGNEIQHPRKFERKKESAIANPAKKKKRSALVFNKFVNSFFEIFFFWRFLIRRYLFSYFFVN